MLQAIRDGIKGWVAWTIVGLIALPFVFMGGAEYFGGGGGGAVVAEVAGEEISRGQLEQGVERRRFQLREMFGGQLPADAYDEEALRREALEQLIDETLLFAYVEQLGLRVSDQQVAREVRRQQVFHEGGEFSRGRYHTLLQRNGLTPEQYESLVRRELLVAQLEEAITGSTLVPVRQVDRLIRLRDEVRTFVYGAIEADRFAPEIDITDAEIEAHYTAHQGDYMAPEAVRLSYLELQGDEADDGNDVEELANLAFENSGSLDPAARHLDLQVQTSGWLTREGGAEGLGAIPEVVAAAFSRDVLEHGYNSDLIEAEEDRYFVVRLEERRASEPRPLPEVADQIRHTLLRQRALNQAQARAEAVVDAVESSGKPLGRLADERGVEAIRVEEARRDERSHPEPVVRSAFELAVGEVVSVPLDRSAVAVVQLDEIRPGSPDALSTEEREQLRGQMRPAAAREDLQSLISALRAEAKIRVHRDRL